ncbi:uncharacterized protein LOC143375366 [Andrena cerasifolii]|uniref:uncharacterized protein LOC143375366 n=1 Tax=Andrena cerasifolii TaxID=2819439 RepID=UPI004038413C
MEKKLIYSSPNVATSYLEFRESIRDRKFEATFDQPGVGIAVDDGAMGSATLEEIEATETDETSTTGRMKDDEDATDIEENGDIPVEDSQVIAQQESRPVNSSSPQDYLEKLAEITESGCPRTEEEVRRTLKRIAEGKAEIESRKSEALKDLSVEFNEFERLVAEQRAFEEKCPATDAKFGESEESLDLTGRRTDAIEMPLTKDRVAESFKIKTMRKGVADDEERRRAELLQECLQVIPRKEEAEEEGVDSIGSQVTMKPEVKLEEEKDNVARIFAAISTEMAEEKAESSAETSKEAARPATKLPSSIVKDIISDTEDSLFWEMSKEPERTYIKGKVYDFDKKKHGVRMTEGFLKKHCKVNKLYQTPCLNDVLYLHYKGFSFIENLERYTGLKCLWLENNGIREIANLENQSELRCLYLQNNLVNRIENLEQLTKLDTLNLSHNSIRRIENLDCLKFLNTLNLSHNYLRGTGDIEHLRSLDSLSVLDVSYNRIDTEQLVDILGDMKELRVACLMGNPVVKTIRLYRKTMILKCKSLKYLDDRPVFPRDRACAEAWMRGGPDEEAAERRRWIQAEQKKINDSVEALINKRKLRKPVGTSEKEAEDTKKQTKEDEEAVCTSNELLHLEKSEKTSGVSSSSSSSVSSSSDEEAENGREDGTGQKRAEKSDGRSPMAEEEKKACGGIGDELLLPRATQTARRLKTPPRLIEEITETKEEYVAGDGERKRLAQEILDARWSGDDPPGGCDLTRELAHYEKLVPETTNETETTPGSCAAEQRNDREFDRRGKKQSSSLDSRNASDDKRLAATADSISPFSEGDPRKSSVVNSSVSCDIMKSGGSSRKKGGAAGITTNVGEESLCRDVLEDYRRRDDRCVLSSQLNSIREDMKQFCAGVDKFVEDNNIVFKNGDVKGFWGDGLEASPPGSAEGDDVGKEKERPMSGEKEDNFKWWSTKERKLRMKEIMMRRDEEAKGRMEKENGEFGRGNLGKIEIVEEDTSEKVSEQNSTQEEKTEGVYDLLNLKTYSKLLLQDVKTHAEDEGNSTHSAPTEPEQAEASAGVFSSLFNELECNSRRNAKLETSKSLGYHELLTIEEIEEVGEDSPGYHPSVIEEPPSTSDTPILESSEEKLEQESVRIEIVEVTSDVTPVNSTDDESDSESVETVINLQEKPVAIHEEAKCSDRKAEADKETTNAQEENRPECCPIGAAESVQVQMFHKEYESPETRTWNAVAMASQAGKSNHSAKSCKRTCDCECLGVARKKSHMIEEMEPEESNDTKAISEASARCREHLTKEVKRFARKESPLIDRCIENLINNQGTAGGNWMSNCNFNEFVACTAATVGSAKPPPPAPFCGSLANSLARPASSRERPRGGESASDVQDVQSSIVQLFKGSEATEKFDSPMGKVIDMCEQFCHQLDRTNERKKLLIEPDFVKGGRTDAAGKRRDALSPRETKQSTKKQTGPLIEVIAKNPANVDGTEGEPEEPPPVDPEDPTMNAALKDRILKSINAPKSEEQMERAKKSADKLMKFSREAMAKGKPLLDRPSTTCNQQLQLTDSRRFFMELMKEEDSAQEVEAVDKGELGAGAGNLVTRVSEGGDAKADATAKIERAAEGRITGGDGSQRGHSDAEADNAGKARKSLEMQVVQEN